MAIVAVLTMAGCSVTDKIWPQARLQARGTLLRNLLH